MKGKHAFCGVVALLAIACGATTAPSPPSPCDRTYSVSSDFSSDERTALERANERWAEIAVAQFCLVDGDASRKTIRRIPYGSAEWQELSRSFGGLNILGVYRGADDSITIVDSLALDLFELVALHELGHAYGLGHVDAPAIMHAAIGTATDFTPNDMTECRRVGACPGLSQSDAPDADDALECALPGPHPSSVQAH
ncbi:MAG: matrixin family metalloprotease [Labilithrix sp.]|nr:matrixin family metalloprotease [Labilithrix sp.]